MRNPFAARFREAAFTLEDTNIPEIAEMLHIAAREIERLESLLNQPEVMNFLEGTRLEAVHQVQRWGSVHDRAKEPQDWFWLIGYLAGKALAAHAKGDTDKALHHTISSAAALAHWHAHIKLGGGLMTPGSSDIQRMVEKTLGPGESDGDSPNG